MAEPSVMTEKEKKIMQTFGKVIPKLTENQKNYLLGLGEGMDSAKLGADVCWALSVLRQLKGKSALIGQYMTARMIKDSTIAISMLYSLCALSLKTRNGERNRKQWKCHTADSTDWNSKENAKMWRYRNSSRKIQFSKGIVRCIIKAVEEGDIFEYKGADTSTRLRASEITPIYGR